MYIILIHYAILREC